MVFSQPEKGLAYLFSAFQILLTDQLSTMLYQELFLLFKYC